MRRRDPAFAFGVGNIQKGPWRPSIKEAQADAVDAGFALPDEHSGTIYLHALADIWSTHELVPVVPRAVAPMPRKKGPSSDAPLTRIERIIARREAQERARS